MAANIKVLGTGCANCSRLEENARLALEQVQSADPGFEGEVEKVTDIAAMMQYGLLSPPGLVINEQLVSKGSVPAPDEIVVWIRESVG